MVKKSATRLALFAIAFLCLAAVMLSFAPGTNWSGIIATTGGSDHSAVEPARRNPRAAADGKAVAPQIRRAALPAENAPLKGAYTTLVQLSDAGNADASLRLFRDLRRCDLRRGAQSVLDGVYYHRPGQDGAAYARQVQHEIQAEPALKEALDQLDRSDALCEGMSAQQITTRGEYLRRAALQNNPEAMVCYLSSYELGPAYLSDDWFDYMSRWRMEAPSMAQQALDTGEPGILAVLIDAYMPDDPNVRRMYALSEVFAPDPQVAYALSLIAVRLANGGELDQMQSNLAQLSGVLQPDQVAKARATADTLWPRFEQHSGSARSLETCHEFLAWPADSTGADQAAQ